MKKNLNQLIENFKKIMDEKYWKENTKDLYKLIPSIISEFEIFYDKNLTLNSLDKKDKVYLKRLSKYYIKKYLLQYPDKKYINNIFNFGKRLFLKGFSEKEILDVYKILFKAVTKNNNVLSKKLDFDFSIILKPSVIFTQNVETKLLKENNIDLYLSTKEAVKIHLTNKNKFFEAVLNMDLEKIKSIPELDKRAFSEWLTSEGKEILKKDVYKEVENLHILFHQKIKKVEQLLEDENTYFKVDTYILLKDIESISLKFLFILNTIILENISDFAFKDQLTGFFNRNIMGILIFKELKKSKRYGYKVSIVIIDLDDFKKVNDTYGHLVGDEVLAHFAKIIKSNIRDSDYPFRYGGEEFLIMLPYADLNGAKIVAEKIRKETECYNFPMVGKITISCGIAELKNVDNIYLDIEEADRYLYIAKKTGKNKCVYEDINLSSES